MSQILSKKISTTSKNDKNYKSIINILIKIIGDTIEKLVNYEQKIINLEDNYNNKISLNLKEIPNITITNYLKRLIKHSKPEPSTLILGVIYFDRICNNGNLILNYFNVYKLLLISLVLAIKFNEEYFETNEFYGRVGGLNNKSINKLEIKVLQILNYNLYVKQDIYENYLSQFSAFLLKKIVLLSF